ncbi:MAG: glycoside hydrolase family 2 TIM barrel-domain containing protein [Clostridia bacterium]
MRGIDFNSEWKFKLAEEVDSKDFAESNYWNPWLNNSEGYAKTVRFDEDDTNWRTVRLPHDWSVEFPFDRVKGEGCTGYLLGGTGWYRKHFVTTEEMLGKKVLVNFDGIYNRANIYCNKTLLTFHPYGYSPCLVDITDNLKPVGEENVINVKVDHTRYADSRWYTGSGIYRKVAMYILPKVNIPVWGLYFTAKNITTEKAIVNGEIEINNDYGKDVRVLTNIKIEDANGNIVAERILEKYMMAHQSDVLKTEFEVLNPMLWDIDNPHSYKATATISVDGEELEAADVKFGIRTFEYDNQKGFFLNGKHRKIRGSCLHHDAGLVGAAVPNDVWRRRLQTLKDGGCNAIRTAHNPYSEDFLNICDEIGLLVQEEFYDEWDYAKDKRLNCFDRIKDHITRGYADFFQEYAKSDLQVVVKRDRNHASIFQWSLGNEIEWVYPRLETLSGYFEKDGGNWGMDLPPKTIEEIRDAIINTPEDEYEIGKTANKLANWTKELDTSRHVVSNCVLPSVSHEIGYTDALDVVGYSHRCNVYDYCQENYPNKPMQGSETKSQWFELYYSETNEYMAGMFMWTGISYMGEASRKQDCRGSFGALVDFAGYERPKYYLAKAWWSEEPTVFIGTVEADVSIFKKDENGKAVEKEEGILWSKSANKARIKSHWNYKDNEDVLLEVYSNCDEVTLYVNGEEKETIYIKDCVDRTARWIVPFVAGEVKAIAKKDGKEYEHILKTAGDFATIEISSDKDVITTDYDSAAHIQVILRDKDGIQLPPTKDQEVKFVLDGAYINMGVDNGSAASFQTYQKDTVVTSKGKAMMILQGKEKGAIKVKAVSGDISSETIEIIVE